MASPAVCPPKPSHKLTITSGRRAAILLMSGSTESATPIRQHRMLGPNQRFFKRRHRLQDSGLLLEIRMIRRQRRLIEKNRDVQISNSPRSGLPPVAPWPPSGCDRSGQGS